MSDYYGNNARLQAMEDVLLDNDLLKLMNEEGIQMGVDIFDEIYNESEHLGGAGGEHIAKDRFERLSSGDPMMNSILIGQKQKIQRNELKIKCFNLTFEPFTDKVKGTIETVES